METTRTVLAIKGFCFGIPMNILDSAFYQITNYIQQAMVTTIVFDGDLLTYVPPESTTGQAVKSYTQLIPRKPTDIQACLDPSSSSRFLKPLHLILLCFQLSGN